MSSYQQQPQRRWGQAFMGLVMLALSVLALGVLLGLFDESTSQAGEQVAAPTAEVLASSQPDETRSLATPSEQTPSDPLPSAEPLEAAVPPEQPQAAPTPTSGLATIAEADLPAEAWDTMQLIYDGGPFPFDEDDETFFNREGILPPQSRGYYREYTVKTPGSRDRGARRIVAGEAGDLYYTDDHYDSFRQIEESR